MISVIIAAYNEERTIGATLDRLLADAAPDEFDIVVVANGCSDHTSVVARRRQVRVIDLPTAGKAAALNVGDAASACFPRLYLDADTPLTTASARALAAACASELALAVSPGRWVQTRRRPLAIRCYYAINNRLPVYDRTLFGRGAVMVSEAGRARFGRFPEIVADDLFLDAQFGPEEKVVVRSVRAQVEAPATVGELITRLSRVRRGNRQLAGSGGGVRRSSRSSWLRDVVLPNPQLLPAALVYAAITLRAEQLARGATRRPGWGEQSWAR